MLSAPVIEALASGRERSPSKINESEMSSGQGEREVRGDRGREQGEKGGVGVLCVRFHCQLLLPLSLLPHSPLLPSHISFSPFSTSYSTPLI